jgi:hypothetical protein
VNISAAVDQEKKQTIIEKGGGGGLQFMKNGSLNGLKRIRKIKAIFQIFYDQPEL